MHEPRNDYTEKCNPDPERQMPHAPSLSFMVPTTKSSDVSAQHRVTTDKRKYKEIIKGQGC